MGQTKFSVGTATNMPDEEWVKKLEDGRKVKFIYQHPHDSAGFLLWSIRPN